MQKRTTPFPISAVIITLNEENMIRDCILSIQNFVDEIIVIDSRSTDSTLSICKELNVRVAQVDWLGYAETKNKGNALAQHDLIFSIDADERADDLLQKDLNHIRMNGIDSVGMFRRKNFWGNHWVRFGGWYPDWKKRIFNKKTVHWGGGEVHEELITRSNQKFQKFEGNLIHLTVSGRKQHLETIHKYAKLAAGRVISGNQKLSFGKAVGSTVWTFLKVFLFKLGLMDGKVGFWVAWGSAQSKWLRYRYVEELKTKSNE